MHTAGAPHQALPLPLNENGGQYLAVPLLRPLYILQNQRFRLYTNLEQSPDQAVPKLCLSVGV